MKFLSYLRGRSMSAILRTVRRYLFGKSGERRVHGLRLLYRLRATAMLHVPRGPATLLRGQEVRIWFDGSEAFPRLRKLLMRAQHTIIIHMFIWKDDETGRDLAELLTRIADRGVRVDITKDATGDVFELHQDFVATSHQNSALWRRFWKHPNISITHRADDNHSKVFIVDDHVLLLGSMNIADEYRQGSLDHLIELSGKQYVDQYLSEGDIHPGKNARVRLVLNTQDRIEIRTCIMKLIENAKHSLILQHSYLADSEVLIALGKATHRGVRLTIFLPSSTEVHNIANRQSIEYLLANAVKRRLRIYLLPGFAHGKMMVVDDHSLFIGSANLIPSSLTSMGEANVLISDNAAVLRRVQLYISKLLLLSRPVPRRKALSWPAKVLAKLGL